MFRYRPKVAGVLWLAWAALAVVALIGATQRYLDAACVNKECYKRSCIHWDNYYGLGGCIEMDWDTAENMYGNDNGGGVLKNDSGNYQIRTRASCKEDCEDVSESTATECDGSSGTWKDKDDDGNKFIKKKCDYSSS